MANHFDLYKKLVETHPDAELKGATIPYTSLNGHMYSYLSKDGFVALRLPEEARNKFLEKYETTLVTAYGIVQREYVMVPENLLKKTAELKPFFRMSYDYVNSLKAKPAKKKKKG
jgi:hypothetical protein